MKLTSKNFPEKDYLRAFPDVDIAIRDGIFKNAYEHFIKAGRAELESGLRQGFLYPALEQNNVPASHPESDGLDAAEDWKTLKTAVAPINPADLTCFIDEVADGVVSGWVRNRNKTYPTFDVWVDGEKTISFISDIARPDVLVLYPRELYVGFKFTVPRRFLNGKLRRIQISAGSAQPLDLMFKDRRTSFIELEFKWERKIISNVDGLSQGAIKGWVLVEGDEGDVLRGGAIVLVSVHGANIAELRANLYRPDVGKTHGADPYCGFEFVAPQHLRLNGSQDFTFTLIPDGTELAGSPATIEFLNTKHEMALASINSFLDQLYADLAKLRREVEKLLPTVSYTIDDYHSWATVYFATLTRSATKMLRLEASAVTHALSEPQPRVSIVCPVFRPHLPDFMQAMQSIVGQTYQNWELILVDDGSKEPLLSIYLEDLAKHDKRVKLHVLADNSGISAATNAAIAQATGQWIAFMDHDDLLVDVALEFMVDAARRTRALVLYSDEDKIDKSGHLSAPAFKPDWNYRLLLGVNYVCHFLMINKSIVEKVGTFNSDYDGAQDHDYLLRVSECVSNEQICHVPEVLYHWRITDKSTASEISNKSYAVKAGIACVSDHLKRAGKRAIVKNFKEATLYKITWQNNASPLVNIVIPFKDNIETTRMCVTRVLELTQYANFNVILVDNWSTSNEILEFMEEVKLFENVKILRVEESFNYARLNNLAVAQHKAELYVFMNNDLFVRDRMWLRTLVNEALADDTVGIVGGKFLYPNGSIQHGGVVLGIGGVAGHIHVGHRAEEGGYAGRAYFAQELSAVTAACMLVKAKTLQEVGGFDEVSLPVAFNDIDLCLKARTAGYRVVWTPEFVADHHESLSRGSDDRPQTRGRFFHETQTMMERWGQMIQHDPFYSKHFDLKGRPFYDLVDPRGSTDLEPISDSQKTLN